MTKNSYLETLYNEKKKPLQTYPKKLIGYLIKRFNLEKQQKILEIGCGRGEFLNEFALYGLEAHGVDLSDYCLNFFPNLNFKKNDLSKEKLPYEDNSFDIIYSKSVIEHFYYPEKIFVEIYRVLKPGGVVITLTPEWRYIYKTFYEDHTHRVPFTIDSLRDIHLMHDFKDVKVESFIQLPIIFEKNIFNKFFKFLSFFTRIFVPDYFQKKTKWIKFSKEIMLLSIAKK